MSSQPARAPDADTLRVLLLEDSTLDAELIARQLDAAGVACTLHRVWTREDFLHALTGDACDVILADHVLPGFDGDQALALAMRQVPHVPFIFVSGTLTEELAVRALKRGATDYVVKQRLQRLPDAVTRAVQESREHRRLHEAESALLTSRKQLQTITDALPVLIAYVDRSQHYRFNNLAYERWMDLPREGMKGRHVREVVGPAAYERLRAPIESALAGEAQSFETTIRYRQHHLRHVQIDYIPDRQADGRVHGFYALIADISERRAAELALRELNQTLEQQVAERTEALRQSEARLRAIFESSFQSQALLAPNGTILDVNATYLAPILATREDVLGRYYWDTPWFNGNDAARERVRRMVARAGDGEPAREELTLHLPGGTRSFDFSMRPIRDAGGRLCAIVPEATETTSRRHAEEGLRQAQKMEAVGQLTGGIAHDFNNLLTVVTGNLELARRRLEAAGHAEERVLRALDNAGRGAERAASLTQRLLAFSRRQPLQPRALAPGELLEGMSQLLRGSLSEIIELEMVLPDGLWAVRADPNQLEVAVLNLAVNARDAMPSGGKLLLEAANVRLDAHQAHEHGELAPGDYVLLCVSDTGEGMPEEVVVRAFEPFFTTKEVGRGTGLGLSMVYGFARQSGGSVQIHSAAGRGTSVKLFLPRIEQGAVDPRQPAPAPAIFAGRRQETILVVEDDADVRAYTAACLQELGYRVLEAADGDAALRLLEQHTQPVELLFTDVVMPGMSGRELVRLARTRHPHLKVLYTSGYTRDEVAPGGDPDIALVSKPFTYAVLSSRVAAALADDGG